MNAAHAARIDATAIAHRGCLADYPENTLHAFRESARVVDMIELDVRRCGSGELVVIHDATLDRVTGESGHVSETAIEALRDRRVLDSDEQIPVLREVFDVVPNDVGLNLELKDDGLAADVLEVAGDFDHDVIVSSFDYDELATARDVLVDPNSGRNKRVPLAYLFMARPDDALDIAAELDCEYVHPSVELACDTDVVSVAHDRGFGVNVWTVETRTQLDSMLELGVDGVIIDDCEFTRTV